jgi:hypothetical protein
MEAGQRPFTVVSEQIAQAPRISRLVNADAVPLATISYATPRRKWALPWFQSERRE